MVTIHSSLFGVFAPLFLLVNISQKGSKVVEGCVFFMSLFCQKKSEVVRNPLFLWIRTWLEVSVVGAALRKVDMWTGFEGEIQ